MAGAHRLNDRFEVLERRIAAAEQGGFALMEFRVGKTDRVGHDGNEYIPAAMSDELEAALHCLGVAGRVEHHVEEVALRQCRQSRVIAVADLHGCRGTQMLHAEIEPVRTRVEGGHRRAAQSAEGQDRHADRPRTDDEHAFTLLHVAAPDRMRANCKELDHGRLIERDAFGLVDELRGYAQVLGERAVSMHAQHLDIHAAIGFAATARNALTARQIRHHEDLVAGCQSAVRRRLFDDAGQLVAHHARIGQIRLVSRENMQVRPAYANTLDAQQHVVFSRFGFGSFLCAQRSWRLAYHG
ncbi:hypothetical protein KCU90_g2783, partial [Aureobasidium melanogenum]